MLPIVVCCGMYWDDRIGAIFGFLLGSCVDAVAADTICYNTISLMLILYGVAFIVVEKLNKNKPSKVETLSDITYSLAFIIGLFQVLSIIPGTSRSGATIVGALIVVQRNMLLDDIVKTGETINANISQRLVEAVFFKNAPLHDGAMIIQNGRITAAQCILPVSHNMNISKKLGLRHRSAIGVTEIYDAIAIVVSEETGTISAAIGGKLIQNLDARKLEEILTKQK